MLNKGTVMKKYSKLYNDIKEQIITGQLSHGDKIPSVRDAAAIYSVSTTTVQNAYFELCADGYIISKEKSGYFVSIFNKEKDDVVCADAVDDTKYFASTSNSAKL